MGKYYMPGADSTSDSQNMPSIIYSVLGLSKNPEIGYVWLVRHPGKDMEESANDDDVILLYLETCLIM